MSTDVLLIPDLAKLPDDVSLLKALVLQLFSTLQEREQTIRKLEQHLHLFVKRFLNPASEKLDPRQLLLFIAEEGAAPDSPVEAAPQADAPDTEAKQKPPRKHTPHGRGRIPDTLERKDVFHDLTPEQKLVLGGEANLVYLGEDIAHKYEWTPSSVVVVVHHQKKYVRRKMADTNSAEASAKKGTPEEGSGVLKTPDAAPLETPSAAEVNSPASGSVTESARDQTPAAETPALSGMVLTPELAARFSSPVIVAPKPPEPIPGGVAGPGLLAQVIVSKYGDHLPLHRLEAIFARQGVHFSRQTMCDWCAGSAKLLKPLWELVRDEVLKSFVIHTDDTPVKLRDAHAKQKCQARFWTYLGDEEHPLTWFEFTTTRQRAGPDRVLANYKGYLQADGYGGYDDYEGIQLSADTPILKSACWAHARRKFHDALRTEPVPAQIALARIAQLYALEKQLRERVSHEWRDLPLAMRAALIAAERRAHAQPVLDAFQEWLKAQAEIALPKSPIAAAVRYARNQWDALCRYVEDGRLAIDNNAAERALRGIAIGRKNWLFCGSEAGGRTAAILFTMVASALRNDLDPWLYLRDVLTRLPYFGDHPSREQLLPLLPNQWKPPAAE